MLTKQAHKPVRASRKRVPANHITIDGSGKSSPKHASISVSEDGRALFNATYPCTLTFDPICPFAQASATELTLARGFNDEPLSVHPKLGKCTYRVSPPPDAAGKPRKKNLDPPADIIINW